MPSKKDQVRRRLVLAALELFRDRGYDQTTASEIAQWAGVTERTFFRHFSDKREVLFAGEDAFLATLIQGISNAANGLAPLGILLQAFNGVEDLLIENRSFSKPRAELINDVPALRERSLTKNANVSHALAIALRQRGVESRLADLAAQTGMAAFGQAFHAWLANPSRAIREHLAVTFEMLELLCSDQDLPATTRNIYRS